MKEPHIHSHIEDCLPETHPLACETVLCKNCGAMVHAFNNECMQTWIETGNGEYCLRCFNDIGGEVLENRYGLNSKKLIDKDP